MKNFNKIKTAIIDDQKKCIDDLVEELRFFPEVEICGFANKYKLAKELLLKEKPDLVFLDIEMPGKTGFELLTEMRQKGSTFRVIFYTAYDKYMIQALRESAFDYILKPLVKDDLKNALDRYKLLIKTQATGIPPSSLFSSTQTSPQTIALPSHLGLLFTDKNRILLFQCVGKKQYNKPCWEALLNDRSSIKLGLQITAEKIMTLLSDKRFIQISQSCIINLNYMSMVEFKTRQCILNPPFDDIELKVSRTHLSKLREEFEVF